jgi:hypothetical protein
MIDTVKAVGLIAGVCSVYALLIFVAVGLTGAGHGTAYFCEVFTAPFCLAPGVRISDFSKGISRW